MSTGQSSSARPSKPGSMPSNDAFEMRAQRKGQGYNATMLSTRVSDDADSTERIWQKGIMINRDVDVHYQNDALDLTPGSREHES